MPTLVYTPPDADIDARLQLGGTRDLLGFRFPVRRATPQLPLIIEDMSVEIGELVNEELPEVLGGGMLPLVYTLDDSADAPTVPGCWRHGYCRRTTILPLRPSTRVCGSTPPRVRSWDIRRTRGSTRSSMPQRVPMAPDGALEDERTFTIEVVANEPDSERHNHRGHRRRRRRQDDRRGDPGTHRRGRAHHRVGYRGVEPPGGHAALGRAHFYQPSGARNGANLYAF